MKHFWIVLLPLFLFFSCDKDDDSPTHTDCDYMVIVSEPDYDETITDNYIIDTAYIEEDCLFIQFGASGCDGNSWEVDLFDAGHIMESFPPQRSLRLSLNNSENCLAFITKTISFDLTTIQISNNEDIILNIDEYASLVYQY